jgi:hypothetical protein
MEYWVQMQIKIILDSRSPAGVVIPGLTRNPVFPWIPAQASLGFAERRAPRRAFAGMTLSARINVTIYRNFFTHYSNIPLFQYSLSLLFFCTPLKNLLDLFLPLNQAGEQRKFSL